MQPTRTSRTVSRTWIKGTIAGLIAATCFLPLTSCGGGGGGLFGGIARLVGKAIAPAAGVIESNPLPLGDAVVQLIDFADTAATRATARTTEVGRTDAEGNYDIEVPAQAIVAVVIVGNVDGNTVRISGLVNPDDEQVAKNLDGVTDVACEAGVSSLMDGSSTPEQFRDGQRIRNLEIAAADLLAGRSINFFNPQEVSAAAAEVRQITNNGANPPPGTESDRCPGGTIVRCQNNDEVCSSKLCDGLVDCADGSDESQALCTDAATCCVAENGCTSESGDFCGDGCCCCPIRGLVCDTTNFANGCVTARSTARVDDDNPLLKLLHIGDL